MVLTMPIQYFDFARENALGYDVVVMNVTEGEITFAAYGREEDGEVAGESLSPSLSGVRLTKKGSSSYLLDDLRGHVRFSDMCCFGLSPHVQEFPFWVDINRDTRSGKAYPALLNRGCPVKIVFPDTESTFLDCIVCVPRTFAGEPFTVISNLPDTLDCENGVSEIRSGMPVVTFSGPSQVAAESSVSLELAVGTGDLGLDSLYDITLQSDAGYLPKRRFRLSTGGEAARVKVRAFGMEAGDEIVLTARMDGYGPVATWKLTVTEQEGA